MEDIANSLAIEFRRNTSGAERFSSLEDRQCILPAWHGGILDRRFELAGDDEFTVSLGRAANAEDATCGGGESRFDEVATGGVRCC